MGIQKSVLFFYRSLLSLAIGTAACLSIPGNALAQVGLAPMVIETESQRGRARGVLTVVNNGSQPKRMRAFTQPFTFDREAGFQSLENDASDLSPYLRFSPQEFVVQPGGRQRIRIMSTMPNSLEDGEYRAIIFTEEIKEHSAQSGVTINARIGSMMYVRHGETQPELSITDVQWDKHQEKARLQVLNSGNASVRPQLQWALEQDGQTFTQGVVQPRTVITGKSRLIPIEFPAKEAELPSGRYELSGRLTWTDENQPASQTFRVPLIIE